MALYVTVKPVYFRFFEIFFSTKKYKIKKNSSILLEIYEAILIKITYSQ